MEKLLKRIAEAAKGIKFNDRTAYIVACKASFCGIENWNKERYGSRPTQYIWLMPEVSHRLGEREKVEKTAAQLQKELGYGFEVSVCPTRSDFLMDKDNYVVISEI
jgi:hypothetical protein